MLYISGIAPVALDGEFEGVTTHPDGSWTAGIRAQTAAVLKRIEAIIRGASGGAADLYDIVDAVVYLTEMNSQYGGMNEEWNMVWADRESAPAGATVGVREPPNERFLVEIKATVFNLSGIVQVVSGCPMVGVKPMYIPITTTTTFYLDYLRFSLFIWADDLFSFLLTSSTILLTSRLAYRMLNGSPHEILPDLRVFRCRIHSTYNSPNSAPKDYRTIILMLSGNGESLDTSDIDSQETAENACAHDMLLSRAD
ncbi:hypothetical protein BDW68DRAFT_179898 [Aspergillus falconensis]